MTVKIHADGVRLFLILPNCLAPLAFRIAALFSDEETRRLLIAANESFRVMRRGFRGLELINVTAEEGVEIVVKI